MLEYWKMDLTGGTRFVVSGHDEAWPSRASIPTFQLSGKGTGKAFKIKS